MLAVDRRPLHAATVQIGQRRQLVDGGHDSLDQVKVAGAVRVSVRRANPRHPWLPPSPSDATTADPTGNSTGCGSVLDRPMPQVNRSTQFDELLPTADLHHNVTADEHRALGIGELESLVQHRFQGGVVVQGVDRYADQGTERGELILARYQCLGPTPDRRSTVETSVGTSACLHRLDPSYRPQRRLGALAPVSW